MTHTTLDNWQAQLTAKGLSHNETVRLIQDAQEQIDALKAQNAVDSEAAQSLTCVISDIAALVGIRDSAPNLCRETVKAVRQLAEEQDALRAALRDVLESYDLLATHAVDDILRGKIDGFSWRGANNARRVLGEVKG